MHIPNSNIKRVHLLELPLSVLEVLLWQYCFNEQHIINGHNVKGIDYRTVCFARVLFTPFSFIAVSEAARNMSSILYSPGK